MMNSYRLDTLMHATAHTHTESSRMDTRTHTLWQLTEREKVNPVALTSDMAIRWPPARARAAGLWSVVF